MKQISLHSGTYLLVEVPDYAIEPWIMETYEPTGKLGYYNPNKVLDPQGEGLMWSESILIPEGQWSIIGKADELNNGDPGNDEISEYCAQNDVTLETSLILKLN